MRRAIFLDLDEKVDCLHLGPTSLARSSHKSQKSRDHERTVPLRRASGLHPAGCTGISGLGTAAGMTKKAPTDPLLAEHVADFACKVFKDRRCRMSRPWGSSCWGTSQVG